MLVTASRSGGLSLFCVAVEAGCILLQRCGKRDFLSIRVRKSCEINAITFSTMKREVQSLKSELRALRTGHLSTSEVRLPWTPEEKLRHELFTVYAQHRVQQLRSRRRKRGGGGGECWLTSSSRLTRSRLKPPLLSQQGSLSWWPSLMAWCRGLTTSWRRVPVFSVWISNEKYWCGRSASVSSATLFDNRYLFIRQFTLRSSSVLRDLIISSAAVTSTSVWSELVCISRRTWWKITSG